MPHATFKFKKSMALLLLATLWSKGMATPTALATEAPGEKKNAIGLAAGMVGGLGISYERWLNQKNALRFNVAPYFLEEKYPGDSNRDNYYQRDKGYTREGFLSAGTQYIHQLGEYHLLEVIAFGGGNLMWTYEEENYDQSQPYYNGIDQTRTTEHVSKLKEEKVTSLGGGLGGIISIWRFEFSAMVGLVGAYDWSREVRRISPSIDIGAHFRL